MAEVVEAKELNVLGKIRKDDKKNNLSLLISIIVCMILAISLVWSIAADKIDVIKINTEQKFKDDVTRAIISNSKCMFQCLEEDLPPEPQSSLNYECLDENCLSKCEITFDAVMAQLALTEEYKTFGESWAVGLGINELV